MEQYNHQRRFTVRHSECDVNCELKPSAILQLLQEAAGTSANELKFGYQQLSPLGIAFVLTNLYVEVENTAHVEQDICVNTWPLLPNRYIFGREYRIDGADGTVYYRASSRWCLLDMKNGKLLTPNALPDHSMDGYREDRAVDFNAWKIRGERGDRPCYQLTVGPAEYDMNRHVNNTKYADFCMNCFTVEELDGLVLSKMQLSYLKQCKDQDKLSLYRSQKGEYEYLIECVRNEDEVVFIAKFEFSPKNRAKTSNYV